MSFGSKNTKRGRKKGEMIEKGVKNAEMAN
jgi:hypothetical protein